MPRGVYDRKKTRKVKATVGTDAPPPKPKPEAIRYFVLNLDCDNYEGEYAKLENALRDIQDRHDDDSDEILVLEVVRQYNVQRKAVAIPVPLDVRGARDEKSIEDFND